MTPSDSDQTSPDSPPAEAPALPTEPVASPSSARDLLVGRRGPLLFGLVAVSMLFGLWGAWRVFAPAPDSPAAQLEDSQRERRGQQGQIEQLQQRVTTLGRSDQISR